MTWVVLALLVSQAEFSPVADSSEIQVEAAAPAPAAVQETPASSEAGRRIPAATGTGASRRIEDRPEAGPSLGGFVIASIIVVGLLGGAFWVLRRWGGRSRLLGGGGPIQVLGRRSLGARQELLVVEVGRRALLLGSTKDGLAMLAEFTNPDELAALRADAPEKRAGSERAAFVDSLRREMRGEPLPAAAAAPADDRAFDTIAQELAEIRKTVHAWKA